MRERTSLDEFVLGEPAPCWHCGDPTSFIEVNFEAHIHPGECEDAKDAEFWAACFPERDSWWP